MHFQEQSGIEICFLPICSLFLVNSVCYHIFKSVYTYTWVKSICPCFYIQLIKFYNTLIVIFACVSLFSKSYYLLIIKVWKIRKIHLFNWIIALQELPINFQQLGLRNIQPRLNSWIHTGAIYEAVPCRTIKVNPTYLVSRVYFAMYILWHEKVPMRRSHYSSKMEWEHNFEIPKEWYWLILLLSIPWLVYIHIFLVKEV